MGGTNKCVVLVYVSFLAHITNLYDIQWHLQRSTRGYVLKNVDCGGFVGINDARSGSQLEKVCEHNASVWSLERQYDDVYT